MRIRVFLLAVLFALLCAAPALAMNVDDIIRLREAGIEDETILAQVGKTGLDADLTIDDLIALRQAGFDSGMIKALILLDETEATEAAATPEPKVVDVTPIINVRPPDTALRDEDNVPVAADAGLVELTAVNRFGRAVSVNVDAARRTITVTEETANFGKVLQPNQGMSVKLPADVYTVRCSGESRTFDITLDSPQAELRLASGKSDSGTSLDFAVTQNGEQSDGGTLCAAFPRAALREPARPIVVEEPVVVRRTYCAGCGTWFSGIHDCPVRRSYCTSCSVWYTGSHTCVVRRNYCWDCHVYYTGGHSCRNERHHCNSCDSWYIGIHTCRPSRHYCSSCCSWYTGGHSCRTHVVRRYCGSCHSYYSGAHSCRSHWNSCDPPRRSSYRGCNDSGFRFTWVIK